MRYTPSSAPASSSLFPRHFRVPAHRTSLPSPTTAALPPIERHLHSEIGQWIVGAERSSNAGGVATVLIIMYLCKSNHDEIHDCDPGWRSAAAGRGQTGGGERPQPPWASG